MTERGVVLDLFSGTGSATQPFVECGKHRVVRIDIAGNPDVRADVRHLPIRPGTKVEFIWASPPCKLKKAGQPDRFAGHSAMRSMIPRALAEAVHRAVCECPPPPVRRGVG